MADSIANVIKLRATRRGKTAHLAMDLSSLYAWGRRIVIKHQCGIFCKLQGLFAKLTNHFDRVDCTRIRHHRKIDMCDDNLSRTDRVVSRMFGENFFNNRTTHSSSQHKKLKNNTQGKKVTA